MKKLFAAVFAPTLIGAAFAGGVVLASQPPMPLAFSPLRVPPEALAARAAILYDLTTGEVLYQENAQVPLPLASLTKLITAQAVLAKRDPSTLVRITPHDLTPEGSWGLRAGDTVSLRALLHLALVASSNDAAAAAAATLGDYLPALNETTRVLGLTRTAVFNPTGLDVTTSTPGAYGSAFDVARLTGIFYQAHPDFFELTGQPDVSVNDGGHTLSFDATMAPLQDMSGFVAAKTGYTDLAGGNLAAVFDLDIGHPVVAVVLHSTQTGRFTDVRTLIESARASHQL